MLNTPKNIEKLLSLILSEMSDAVFICDRLGTLTYFGGQIEEIFGYSTGELEQLGQINHLLSLEMVSTLAIEHNATQVVFSTIEDKLGNPRPLKIKLKKIFLNQELFLIICRDLSELNPIPTELQQQAHLQQVVELRTEQLKLANRQLEQQIVERQQAEADMQNTVDRLTTIIETVAEGITVGDDTGRFEVFNSKMEEITGYTKDEANNCADFLALLYPSPLDYHQEIQEVERLKLNQKTANRETTIYTKSGQSKTLQVSSSILKKANKPLFLSAYRDITKRQAAEKALIESEARKKALLDAIPDALFGLDSEGTFLEFIPAKNFKLLVPVNEFIGKKITDVLSAPLGTTLSELVVKTLTLQTTQVLEYQLAIENQRYDYEARMAVVLENQVLAIVRDISDRKQAERVAEKQMQWNQLILDTTMDGFCRFDDRGTILEVNLAFARMVQYSREHLVGMNLQDLLALDSLEDVSKHLWAICHPSSVQRSEESAIDPPHNHSSRLKSKYRRADGDIIYVEMTVTATELGEETLLFGFIRDISDRVATAQALLESQRFIQKITDTVPVLIYIYDAIAQTYRYFNSQINNILGYSFGQIQEMEQQQTFLKNLLHPDDIGSAPMMRQRWENIKDGEIIQTEMRLKTADGVWRNFQCEETVFLRGENNLPQQILGVAIDITEQQQTQETLLRLSKAVNSTSDAIGMTDLKGHAMYVNPAFVKLFGYELSDLIAEGGPVAVYTDPTVTESVFSTIVQGGSWHGEVKMHARDGRMLDILLRADAIKDESGNPIGFIGIHTDISDRKRAKEQLAHHTMELARSNAELEQFAYVASHDLQEPLRIITSYTQLLSRRYLGKFDSKADKYIHFTVNAAQRMQQLIEDLLEFSRIGSHKTELVPVECEDVLHMAMDNLDLMIRRSGATVTHDSLPRVMGDRNQLVQLFQNLMNNGIKYRAERSPIIHICATSGDRFWRFAVRDNGIGIAPEFSDRIFTIFQRLHTREEYPGNGIGLAMCKKIVQQHGGRIWVQSEIGVGSTFYFTLPASN